MKYEIEGDNIIRRVKSLMIGSYFIKAGFLYLKTEETLAWDFTNERSLYCNFNDKFDYQVWPKTVPVFTANKPA